MRQPQWLHSGASAWIAHSKQSNTWLSPLAVFTSKVLSYWLPQTSQAFIGTSFENCSRRGRAHGDSARSEAVHGKLQVSCHGAGIPATTGMADRDAGRCPMQAASARLLSSALHSKSKRSFQMTTASG